MTRVLALTRYGRLGGSSRVRVLQYIPELARRGIEVQVAPLFGDDDLRRLYSEGRRSAARLLGAFRARLGAIRSAAPADIIWLQQEIFPFLPYVGEAAVLAGRKLVIDYDDANHLFYQDAKSRLVRAVYGDKIARLMRRADTVTVGSPAMADYAKAAGAGDVRLIYSAVDTTQYPPPADPATRAFTVGWIGTPMTAAQNLHLIRAPLARFLSETGARAVFIGMDQTQYPDLPGARRPWSEDTEREILPQLSVGLCPLEDTPWTRGKSGYKIIQYMAAGTPALTSPVGIAADIVEDGVTGFHCQTAEDWYSRLMTLYHQPNLLQAQAQHSRATAVARYDRSIAAAHFGRIFEGLR